MRNDIQALRAAAVLMVIANHLFPGRVGGGYVGVDVFFVISGFLISGHLVREADATGKVRLGAFWARRARRLLPAALLVLSVCAVVVALRAPIAVWKQNFVDIAFAATYGLNWRLASQSLNYFDQGIAQTIVNHYWSLSVEEQFYLVWPLIVLAVYLLAHRQPVQRRRVILAVGFGVILVASFAWAAYSTATSPEAAYFETTGRAWEFAAGGLIALLPAVPGAWRTRLVPVVWIAWLVLAAGSLIIGPTWGVPGPAALIPVAATGVVLLVGESERWFGTRYVTALWPVRTIGDVSYSAYLWHWPLIVALPWFLGQELTVTDRVIIVIATLGIAWLSKRFIEDPVRMGRPAKWRPSRTIIAALATMAIVAGSTLGGAVGLQGEQTAAAADVAAGVATLPQCFGVQASLTGANCPHSHVVTRQSYLLLDGIWDPQDASNETHCAGFDNAGTEKGGCSFGVPAGTQRITIALVGDSHAYMWAPALDAIAAKYSARIYIYSKGFCSATDDLREQFAGRTAAQIKSCNAWRTATDKTLVASKTINLIVTASRASRYRGHDGTGAADDGHGYVEAWNRWLASGKGVIAIADPPYYNNSPEQCLASDTRADPCASPLSVVATPNSLSSAAAEISNPLFAYADYSSLFCDTICHSVVGGLPVTRDGQHLTSFLVQSFGDAFLKQQIAQVLAAVSPSNSATNP